MALKKYKLLEKISLTQDVFELSFSTNDDINHKPGQFITFILDKIGGRSYSILSSENNYFNLIIKRLEDGRGGSKAICDMKIGNELNGVGPIGHFVIKDSIVNKLFAGTGTGFVPLYNQIKYLLNNDIFNNIKIKLIFGVRFKEDLFYTKELKELKNKYNNFSYELAISREELEGCYRGYITDLIGENIKENYEEFYLCGAPVVVDSLKEKITKLGFKEEQIFTEKY